MSGCWQPAMVRLIRLVSSEAMWTRLWVCVCVRTCQSIERAVTGSVSWALPFGCVSDFRGERRGGQDNDGGRERKRRSRRKKRRGAWVTFGHVDKVVINYRLESKNTLEFKKRQSTQGKIFVKYGKKKSECIKSYKDLGPRENKITIQS